jgi:hypothetical protein
MRSGPVSSDDALLARLQAPPDLREGAEALEYWRGRRQRLPWYRVAARREAAQMAVVWEKRVRAALIRQRGLPTTVRVEAARLIAGIWFRRSARRVAVPLTLIAMTALVVAPFVLILELILHAL